MSFPPGSLVRARNREWVVLPGGATDVLLLRPLGGSDLETVGVYTPVEKVEPAVFSPPDPSRFGDFASSKLLRDAIRLGIRSSAGPFRCFGAIAVEPRPYQLVPLLMALKLDPVRLLIADDVGIGKTIEAALIAKELLERGEIRRVAILCPPHLTDQWHGELRDKFHLDATLVLTSTAPRLERELLAGRSLFEEHPVVVVSTDFIKSERRRHDFLRTCPEFVIVDEAHLCASAADGRSARHQRHDLIRRLAEDASRHLVLVTATPHSGNDAAFRSLLALLRADFATLPDDLSGRQFENQRRVLATHVVQRRRPDIASYLDASTRFPSRMESEQGYQLSAPYKELFRKALAYARETVQSDKRGTHRQRVRWWAVLAMLRALASSPAAAAATFRSRTATADTSDANEADEIGRREVLDIDQAESVPPDTSPGSETEEEARDRRLTELAKLADGLLGPEKDLKLAKAIRLLQEEFLRKGHQPIVFCRFIETSEYVAAQLRKAFPDYTVASVTGLQPPDERERRVAELAAQAKRILVCTDCLSEGINLQDHFDAVFHYDLSWNPTRHEQREGRVDRFGQPHREVRVMTYYGTDNQIDGIVLDVLIRKHSRIRQRLGISVPIPVDTNQVIEAIMEGVLLRGKDAPDQLVLPGLEDVLRPQQEMLDREWKAAEEREKKSRSVFAQHAIKVDEVAREVAAVRATLGSALDLQDFLSNVLRLHGAVLSPGRDGRSVVADLAAMPLPVREAMALGDDRKRVALRFDPLEGDDDAIYVVRTHPLVSGLATYVSANALDPLGESVARRCGVIRTKAVPIRTTLIVLRTRYHLTQKRGANVVTTLVEDCYTQAWTGEANSPQWLTQAESDRLLDAAPAGNVLQEQARQAVRRAAEALIGMQGRLEEIARQRAQELLDANRRVRQEARDLVGGLTVTPQLPSDIVGIYVLLPAGGP